jgi:hypothetical protein
VKRFLIVLVVLFFSRFVVGKASGEGSFRESAQDEVAKRRLAICGDRRDGDQGRVRHPDAGHLIYAGRARRDQESSSKGCQAGYDSLSPKAHYPILPPSLESRASRSFGEPVKSCAKCGCSDPGEPPTDEAAFVETPAVVVTVAAQRHLAGSGSIAHAAWCKTFASQPRSWASLLRVRPVLRAVTTGASGNALRLSFVIVLMIVYDSIISE